MAADLSIHVLEGCDEEDLRIFFSSTLGSKWFGPFGNIAYDPAKRPEWQPRYEGDTDHSDKSLAFTRIANSPSCWIGEVSWLKAWLAEDPDSYIPSAVGHIHEAIGEELPVLDEKLRESILFGLQQPNLTPYSIEDVTKIKDFLDRYMGKQLFTVSW